MSQNRLRRFWHVRLKSCAPFLKGRQILRDGDRRTSQYIFSILFQPKFNPKSMFYKKSISWTSGQTVPPNLSHIQIKPNKHPCIDTKAETANWEQSSFSTPLGRDLFNYSRVYIPHSSRQFLSSILPRAFGNRSAVILSVAQYFTNTWFCYTASLM